MRLLLPLLLLPLALPLAAADHTEGAVCGPWTPTVGGTQRVCANPTHEYCPFYVQHRGMLSYDVCFPPESDA